MIFDGSRTVTTAGTRVALESDRTMAFFVIVQALNGNGNAVFVGGATIASGRGARLAAGDSVTFPAHPNNIYDLREIFVDAAVDGEGVSYIYVRR